jgi:hypothetical protein
VSPGVLSRIFALCILYSTPCFSSDTPPQDPYRFTERSFQEAIDQKKLIYLFVGSDVCLESRHFLRQIVQDKSYFDLVSKRFLFRILDYDLNPSLTLRYALPTIPGFLILDSKANIYLGGTRPEKEKVFELIKSIADQFETNPAALKDELDNFRAENSPLLPPQSIETILDSTMNLPNHLSLDLGRYILSLPASHTDFHRYSEQLKEWVKSENFDFVEGSYFMPRGYCTYHAEGKYSFFNFKLQEMLIDFYARTGDPAFKYAFLKSLKYLKRDLFLSPKTSYSIGYGSKKYFKLALRERLLYYPPSPRRSDLALSQVLYLKILYKLHHLLRASKLLPRELEFLKDHLQRKLELFSQVVDRYKREDGLLYFTSQKRFANFETQVEFFALLQLMERFEEVDSDSFFQKMESLVQSFHDHFYDEKQKMYCDVPLKALKESPHIYQYPLYFIREHSRLFLFLDFLKERTKKPKYEQLLSETYTASLRHNSKNPHRFYWLAWYRNIIRNRLLRQKKAPVHENKENG